MNAIDVLQYGYRTVMTTIEGLPESEWETSGVCGYRSVKDIIAHLASYEHILVDVLYTLLQSHTMTPYLTRWQDLGDSFNDIEVARRQENTAVSSQPRSRPRPSFWIEMLPSKEPAS